jgi:hypothetical protein
MEKVGWQTNIDKKTMYSKGGAQQEQNTQLREHEGTIGLYLIELLLVVEPQHRPDPSYFCVYFIFYASTNYPSKDLQRAEHYVREKKYS